MFEDIFNHACGKNHWDYQTREALKAHSRSILREPLSAPSQKLQAYLQLVKAYYFRSKDHACGQRHPRLKTYIRHYVAADNGRDAQLCGSELWEDIKRVIKPVKHSCIPAGHTDWHTE